MSYLLAFNDYSSIASNADLFLCQPELKENCNYTFIVLRPDSLSNSKLLSGDRRLTAALRILPVDDDSPLAIIF